MSYKIAKGVFDILPQDPAPDGQWRCSHLWQFIESKIREHAKLYGLREIRTPLFESTDLFKRSIGQTTDIVSKEMYTFADHAGRSLTLRPEGTAPVMRAFMEKRLDQQNAKQSFFYIAPMFRYERQQAGRYRQHHQFGCELIGESSPLQDVEAIECLLTFYQKLGIQNLTLYLNSIGTPDCRAQFRQHLIDFLTPLKQQLSEDSQRRLESNPLRILDSKAPCDIALLENAPSILDHLSSEAKNHFQTVLGTLDSLGIHYIVNPRLVRGLDYYQHTVFEITAGELGAQNSIGGGGRYDLLLKQLGGPSLPAIGFGTGIERILQTCLQQNTPLPSPPKPQLYFIPLDEKARVLCFNQLSKLRAQNIEVEMDFSGRKLKTSLSEASKREIPFVGIIGEEERVKGACTLKNMRNQTSETVPFEQITHYLK